MSLFGHLTPSNQPTLLATHLALKVGENPPLINVGWMTLLIFLAIAKVVHGGPSGGAVIPHSHERNRLFAYPS